MATEAFGVYSDRCFLKGEEGIRDLTVTGVQTCALPIWTSERLPGYHFPRIYLSQRIARIAFANAASYTPRRRRIDKKHASSQFRACPRQCPRTPRLVPVQDR